MAQANVDTTKNGAEPYRPQIHFSPKAHWMNDPNGMVYNKGIYHLFYQYYPDSIVWGPMHWGHATSKDLVHWQELPIALSPDKIGYIFSGSAVVDAANTSGFGKAGKAPLVAIFTQHDIEGEKNKKSDTFQTQSLAYSNDEGKTWTKYSDNPVLKNPGIRDFRDPKVMWYAPQKKWIMTLATNDRVTFYSSKNLKEWEKESEFGVAVGAHGGVWECPDLFALTDGKKIQWVLIASVEDGAPNGGSGTQYFLGNFDGNQFTTAQTEPLWIDYGPDNYAGVTWSNTATNKLFIGWMSNWRYAEELPTENEGWRNAMTLPRELKLAQVGGNTYLTSIPVTALQTIAAKPVAVDIAKSEAVITVPCRINLQANPEQDFKIRLSNTAGEELLVGYDATQKTYYIDRSRSGKTNFHKEFAAKATAPRLATSNAITVSLVLDASSIELFADGGLTVMTALVFPNGAFNKMESLPIKESGLKKLEVIKIKSAVPVMADALL